MLGEGLVCSCLATNSDPSFTSIIALDDTHFARYF